MLGLLYAHAALARRRASRRAGAQRRLQRPVVSVGQPPRRRHGQDAHGRAPRAAADRDGRAAVDPQPRLRAGGRARRRRRRVGRAADVRRARGERRRADAARARRCRARACSCRADRYLAGRLAELHLGATVHLLDDGFQHLPLWRGTDLRHRHARRRRGPAHAADGAAPRAARRRPHRRSALLVADATDDEAARIKAAVPVDAPVQAQPRSRASRCSGTRPGPWPRRRPRERSSRWRASPGPRGSSPSWRRRAGMWPGTAGFADHYRYRPRDIAATGIGAPGPAARRPS